MLKRHPELRDVVTEVDTVGNERGFYRKVHFQEMRVGIRKLQAYGFRTRSHHGETWDTLRQGIQAVDNAMNIWHVDAVEHGLSMGINPNFYFHGLLQRILGANRRGDAVVPGSREHAELLDMDWSEREEIRDKLLRGERVSASEATLATKTKFPHARLPAVVEQETDRRARGLRRSSVLLVGEKGTPPRRRHRQRRHPVDELRARDAHPPLH